MLFCQSPRFILSQGANKHERGPAGLICACVEIQQVITTDCLVGSFGSDIETTIRMFSTVEFRERFLLDDRGRIFAQLYEGNEPLLPDPLDFLQAEDWLLHNFGKQRKTSIRILF